MKRIFKAIRTSIAILSTIANNALTIFSLRESPIRVSFSYIMLIISLLAATPTIAQEIHTADLIGDDNDIQQIDVLINGEKIRFDFDTGCTELSISQETFNKLRESKAISNSDMTKERGELSLGDNSKRRYKTFYIDTLTIGDVNLYNVKAHITLTDNKKSSSLLGHSILKRFKWYTVANNKLTFELKDSATISFYRIEEELDALYTKKKCYKKVVELIEPYENNPLLTDYCSLWYAHSLSEINQTDKAIPLLKDLLTKEYSMTEVYSILLNCYVSIYDNISYNEYARKFIDYQLSKEQITEDDLYKKKYQIDHLGLVYYNLYVYAANTNNKELERRYKRIFRHLGYKPE